MPNVVTVSVDGMSEAARFVLYINHGDRSADPLELLMKLEEEALRRGYANVHDFINEVQQQQNKTKP